MSLKAIRGYVNRYLRQPPNNKPWSIVGDSAFQKSNKVLNAICKQMMQEGKVGPTLRKHPITSEQLQQLYGTGQLGEWDTLDPSQFLRTEWFYITFCLKGMKITESSLQICWFFGVHLKGDVTMSFAAPFCPQIEQITPTNQLRPSARLITLTSTLIIPGITRTLSNNCLKDVFLTCFLTDQLGETKTIRPFALKGHRSMPNGLLTRSPFGPRD